MKYAIAATLLLLAGAAQADDLTKPEWFACETDRDCGRTETPCGDPQPVNLKHYKEYSAYMHAARETEKCEPIQKVINLREVKSVCVGGQCGFNPPPKHAGDN